MSRHHPMILHKIGLSGVAHDENPLAVKLSGIFNIVVAAFILLVPIMWLVDQYTYNQGNPFLRPQFTHSLGLNYT